MQPVQFHGQLSDLGSQLFNLALGVALRALPPGLEHRGHVLAQVRFPRRHLGGVELVLAGDVGDGLVAAEGETEESPQRGNSTATPLRAGLADECLTVIGEETMTMNVGELEEEKPGGRWLAYAA